MGYCSYQSIYLPDLSGVTLSSSIVGKYRNYNAIVGNYADFTNINIYGPKSGNYNIVQAYTLSGNITKIPLADIKLNKIYDKTKQVGVMASNLINSDIINYPLEYNDYNVGDNKPLTTSGVVLYNNIIDLVDRLKYYSNTYYDFNSSLTFASLSGLITSNDYKFGTSSLYLDASKNNSLYLQNIIIPTEQVSYSIWVKPNQCISGTCIFEIGSSDLENLHSLFIDYTRIKLVIHRNNMRTTEIINSNVNTNTWSHIVLALDTKIGATDIYVNNSLVQSTNFTGTPTTSQGGIRLMRRWDNAEYWGGRLASVKIYNAALPLSDVSANWNNGKSKFGL
jgi:hypothetical protein